MNTDAQAQLPEGDRSSGPGQGLGSWSPAVRRGAVVGGLLALVLLVNVLVLQPFRIPSGSMENTVEVGDRVLVNKVAYRFGGVPRRGDVVVFDGTGSFVPGGTGGNPAAALLRKWASAVGLVSPPDTDYIKRVIGVGGDRVVCCDKLGRIKVNGEPLGERYLHPGDEPSAVPFDIVVPRGRLWVMGDHRSASRDSRDHLGDPGGGTVPVERVIGRADWIGWPFDRWTSLRGSAGFGSSGGFGASSGFDRVPAAPAAGAHG